MKLLRYGPRGQEKPGLLDRQGKLRDLAGVIADLTPDQLRQAPSYSSEEMDRFGSDKKVDTYYGGLGYPPQI